MIGCSVLICSRDLICWWWICNIVGCGGFLKCIWSIFIICKGFLRLWWWFLIGFLGWELCGGYLWCILLVVSFVLVLLICSMMWRIVIVIWSVFIKLLIIKCCSRMVIFMCFFRVLLLSWFECIEWLNYVVLNVFNWFFLLYCKMWCCV